MPNPILEFARLWLERDGKIALATVIETWGSAPVRVGGQMVVSATGEFEGSVSGGCVEGDVIANAEETLDDGALRTLAFGVEDQTAWAVGLPCGGKIRVMVERLAGEDGKRFLNELQTADAARKPLTITTNLKTGARQLAGFLGSDALSGIISADGADSFRLVLAPPQRTVIIGATHIGQALASYARLAEHQVTVIDPRTAFASTTRFEGVTLITDWPQDALKALALDPFTAVAVVAHVEHIDDEALIAALRSNTGYVGALGSKRSHARRVERLTAAGLTTSEIARIKAPIGLNIGAATPPEIALSIMAEIVAALRKRASAATATN